MNNDLISREALKKQIIDLFEEEVKIDKQWAMGLKYSLKIIDNAPTVSKDNRPNICFNCEHCCALSVNSDGKVTVMCNLGAENCDNLKGWRHESSYASKQRAYKEGKYDGFMKSPYGD